ncbi:MAG TPA: ferritin-like domain-containing protein [Candidatus Obscuribacterales bacterium]
MSNRQLVQQAALNQDLSAPDFIPFDSKEWLNYFEENRKARPEIKISCEISLQEPLQKNLVKSLQRFQIGETGDGRHLRKYASRLGDAAYIKCVDLFVKEEQNHAQILGEVILAMNGLLLSWHWSDLAFIALRRLLGLKTELFILLIAEIIGKCFYKSVADKVDEPLLKDIFSLIVLDEIAHIQFHTDFLANQLKNHPPNLKRIVHYGWCIIFFAACFVFVADHRASLRSLGIGSSEFISKCAAIFRRSARCVFASNEM